jgi:hypothetical protein
MTREYSDSGEGVKRTSELVMAFKRYMPKLLEEHQLPFHLNSNGFYEKYVTKICV